MVEPLTVCRLLVTREHRLTGTCTRSGHCWAAHSMSLLHRECRKDEHQEEDQDVDVERKVNLDVDQDVNQDVDRGVDQD